MHKDDLKPTLDEDPKPPVRFQQKKLHFEPLTNLKKSETSDDFFDGFDKPDVDLTEPLKKTQTQHSPQKITF